MLQLSALNEDIVMVASALCHASSVVLKTGDNPFPEDEQIVMKTGGFFPLSKGEVNPSLPLDAIESAARESHRKDSPAHFKCRPKGNEKNEE
jgi:hypothetical protein